MLSRCAVCGAKLDDDGTCPRCELEPVGLEDADVGIRHEDRYVALPPGPRWVPRRVRRESPVGPLVALAGAIGVLALMVVLAPGDTHSSRTGSATPILDEPTGLVVRRVGPWGAEEIDLDTRRIRSVAVPADEASSDDVDLPRRHAELRIVRSTCDDDPCVVVDDGSTSVVEVANPIAVTLAPDGQTLAVLAPGDESVFVDLGDSTITPIGDGSTPREITAWSPDGSWLFALTREGAITAIRRDGERFHVPAGPRLTDRLDVRTGAP